MARLKASLALMVTLLLISSCAFAEEDEYEDEEHEYDDEDDYGEEFDDDYGGDGDNYFGDDYDPYDNLHPFGDEDIVHIPGVLDLDRFTFDKVIGGSYPVMVLFYHEDISSDQALREYDSMADSEMAGHEDLILAKLHADIEEDIMDDVMDKSSLDSLPALVFFAKGSTEPLIYEGAIKADEIAAHLVDLVGQAGKLKLLAPLVAKFMSDKGARHETLKETQAVIEEHFAHASEYVLLYLNIMTKVIKEGDKYIPQEFNHLLRVVYDESDSLVDGKVVEFRDKLTILKIFDPALKEVELKKKAKIKVVGDQSNKKIEL